MDRRALCIGINDYPGTQNDLHGCVNDAHDWAAALSKRGFEVAGMLIDKAATGDAMRSAMRGIVQGAKSGDEIVITYSGHGSYVPDENGDEKDGTDECLCPHDITRNGPIIDDELDDIFRDHAKGVRVVLIADSCNSGTVSKFQPITTPAPTRRAEGLQRLVRFLPPENFLSERRTATLGAPRVFRAASAPGRSASLLLAACREAELSYDAYFDDRPNGAFTFIALDELAKLPAAATFRDWLAKIRKRLPTQQYPQTPQLYGASTMKAWKVFGGGGASDGKGKGRKPAAKR